MRESEYQAKLIARLYDLFPGCFVLKTDCGYTQGIPDLLIMYSNRWAALEVKISRNAEVRPNQNYYIFELNEMSFASFIYPENEEEVLNALQQALRPRRKTRVSKCV